MTDQVVVSLQTLDEPSDQPVKLPPELLRFVLSSRYHASVESIRQRFRLTNDDILFVSDLDRLVMVGELDLDNYLVALDEEFAERLSDEERDALYAQLLAEHFLPLGDRLLPSAVDVARDEHLTLPTVPYYMLYVKPLTYTVLVNELATSVGLRLEQEADMRERLRDIVIGKVTGARTDAQLREMLLRQKEYGGVGLDAKTTDALFAALQDILSRAEVLSEDAYATRVADQTQKTQTVDEKEMQEIKVTPVPAATRPSSELEKDVEATAQSLSYKPTDDYLVKRLRYVISSRFRDVRSPTELRQLLTRDVKVGGLGLPADQAESLGQEIETAYQKYHDQIANEETHRIDIERQDQKKKIEERKRREAEEHARWFEEKIRARKTAGSPEEKMKTELQRLIVGPTTPIMSAGSTPRTTVQVLKKDVPAYTRPAVDAVQSSSAPQLVGLLGELRNMSVAEFRRLSLKPEDAVRKIYEKLQTLEEEGAERKIEGIKVFRSSPLHTAYLTLVSESLSRGRPIGELAEEKRKQGGDSLSSAEIQAMMALNQKLHF